MAQKALKGVKVSLIGSWLWVPGSHHLILAKWFTRYWKIYFHVIDTTFPFLFNIGINSALQKFEVKPNLNSSQWQRFAIICIVAVFASRNSCLFLFPHKEKAGASPGSEDVIVEKWKQTTGTTSGSSELALSTTSAVELLQETSLHQAGLGSLTAHPFLAVRVKVTQAGLRECSEGLAEGWGRQW